AGRASRAPDLHPATALRREHREDLVLERTELVVLAEEVRLVRGQEVARLVPLLGAERAILEELVVVGERGEAVHAQALAQTPLERGARLRPEPDAEALGDEVAQEP